MRTAKTLIRLGGCPGWSESSLGAQSFCWFCHEAAHAFDCKAVLIRRIIEFRIVFFFCFFSQIGKFSSKLGKTHTCFALGTALFTGSGYVGRKVHNDNWQTYKRKLDIWYDSTFWAGETFASSQLCLVTWYNDTKEMQQFCNAITKLYGVSNFAIQNKLQRIRI